MRGPTAAAGRRAAPTISCSRRRARSPRRVPASGSALSPRQETAGCGRARRRLGRCGGGAAAPRQGERPRARRSAALRRGARDRRRRAGLPRSAPADDARHRRGAVGAAGAAAAAGGAGQSRRGGADQGGLRRAGGSPAAPPPPLDVAAIAKLEEPRRGFCSFSPRRRTILKPPAIALAPVDRRRAGGAARRRRLPAGAHVRLGRDLLRAFASARRGGGGGKSAARRQAARTGGCARATLGLNRSMTPRAKNRNRVTHRRECRSRGTRR